MILLEELKSLGGSITSTTYNKQTKVGYKNTDTTHQTDKNIHRETDRPNKERQTKDRQTDFKLSSTILYLTFFART